MHYLISLLFVCITLFASHYDVNPQNSQVTFKIKHLIFSTIKGEFKKFEGTYELIDGNLKNLKGSVDVASVYTGSIKRDKNLVSKEFFDVEKYPHMTMQLLYVQNDEAVVSLRIKEKEEQIRLKIEHTDKRLKLTGQISRKTFGLRWSKSVEAGGLVVGDKVNIKIIISY